MRGWWREIVRPDTVGRIAASIGLGVIALGSGLGLSALAAWLIAKAWQMPPVLDLSVAVVCVRALGISRGLFRYCERLSTHDVALRAMTDARVAMYRRFADGPADAVAALRRGDVLTAIGVEIDALGAVVVRAIVPIAVAVVLSLMAVGLLAVISLPAAGILAVALLVSGLLAPMLAARAARAAENDGRAARADHAAHALTALDHAAELRVAGRLGAVLAATSAADTDARIAERRAATETAWAAAATPLSIGVSVFGALLVGIVEYRTGAVTTPMSLAIMVLLPLSAFEAVAALPAAAKAWNHAADTARDQARRGARRDDGTRTRPQLTMPRPDCRRLAVVGPSGVGKTTLLMSWAGEDAVFFAEDAHLFDTTVLENLRVARGDLTRTDAEAALRAVGLADWLDSLPQGCDTHLIGGAGAVSGGQRRRLLLARAAVSSAQALLLDEPTEHLSAEDSADLLRALLDVDSGLIAPDRDVVVVTHHLPPDNRADRVIVLEDLTALDDEESGLTDVARQAGGQVRA